MNTLVSRYISAAVALGLALSVVSCTDLTEVPRTEITEANFNPGAGDLAALMAPAYTPLRAVWMGWYGNLDLQEETADALLTPVRPNGWYDGGVYVRLHEHRWTPGEGQPTSLWNRSFSGINAANRVLYQIDSGTLPMQDATRQRVEAELQALRAYYYSLLLDNFGRVPIVTNFAATELPTQASRQEVYDFVVRELSAALPHLSEEVGRGMYGRVNRWAALGILARVYLNAEVYTGTPQWQKVLEVTQEIMGSAHFMLEPNYKDPFTVARQLASRELIWAVPYDAVFAGGSSFHMKTLKPDLRFVFGMQAQPWGGSASNPQFIDSYDANDARLGATWLRGPQFDSQGRGYDFVKHVPAITGPNLFNHGYPVWKYEIYSGMTGNSSVDYPIVRYAEVLMMRAEAMLRTGQGANAAAIVSDVRRRAFVGANAEKAVVTEADLMRGSSYNYGWYDPDGVVKSAPGGNPVQNGGAGIQYGRFLDELGWEFAIEGHRRQQLIRFGVFTAKTWYNRTPNGQHRAVFAIPTSAMNTNPNLTQNSGY
jgi:starch-binding outer membrane protein, SusD/RagB family